jgi:hypothetical protein
MRVAVLLAVLALALAASAGVAQEPPPDRTVPDRIPAAPAVTVVPIRSERFLRDALEDTKRHDREAEATLSRATDERAQTRARIEVKKREIATIDARRKLADREKHEGAKADRRLQLFEANLEATRRSGR